MYFIFDLALISAATLIGLRPNGCFQIKRLKQVFKCVFHSFNHSKENVLSRILHAVDRRMPTIHVSYGYNNAVFFQYLSWQYLSVYCV